MSIILYLCFFLCCSVNGFVCHVFCVSYSVCELFGKTICHILGVVLILLLNVMEVLSVWRYSVG